MLKKSDNMIADTVFRTIGHARFSVPGTWRAGSDAVRQILRQQAGVDLRNTIIADGSGLSRHNLIAPATMMQVLQYISPALIMNSTLSRCCLWPAMMVLCSTAQGCIRQVSMAKSRRKRAHCRGCITWPVSSRRPAGEDSVRAIPVWLRRASGRPA